MSARCGRCDRIVMPTPDGRCSWCHSVIVDEDRLSSKAMRAQLTAAPAPPAEIVQSAGRDRPNSREAILDAFRRFRTEHGRWPLPGDAADYSYLPYRPSSARHGAVGRHFAGWQGIWTALDAGHIPTGRAAWKYKLTGTLRPAALPEREPKGRETPVLSGASPAADPGVGSTAAAVVNDSPEQLLGGAELGSRSESADALRALVAAARAFLDTLEKEIP